MNKLKLLKKMRTTARNWNTACHFFFPTLNATAVVILFSSMG